MKRLWMNPRARQWKGSSSTKAAGRPHPAPGVPDRRHGRLGGRARSVHAAPQAPPRRQRDGVRAHPAPRSHARELLARSAGQGHADGGQPGRRTAPPSSRTTSTSSRPTRTSRSTAAGLTLVPRSARRATAAPAVDCFLRSLAAERGSHAIGVVLSGTASDGTEGLRAIKAENGITLAQDPASAKFGGMPRSAVDAGVVDAALAIPELAARARASEPPPLRRGCRRARRRPATPTSAIRSWWSCATPSASTSREYKRPTFERRLARRMALRRARMRRPTWRILAAGAGRGPRPLRRHPHSRHLVLPGPGGLRRRWSRRSSPRS